MAHFSSTSAVPGLYELVLDDTIRSPSPPPPMPAPVTGSKECFVDDMAASSSSKQAAAITPETSKGVLDTLYLPLEVVQEVLSWLGPHDYDAARLVCRQWFDASLTRVFLERHIHELNVKSYGKSGCPRYCPCKERLDNQKLRKNFGSMISEWPGSRFRLRCSKSVLDASAVLDMVPDIRYTVGSGARNTGAAKMDVPGFENVAFSYPTGSFAGMVVPMKSKRQLYIYRLFSRTHKSFQARQHRSSNCPCEPGPLYMILDIKAVLDMPIRAIEIEEIENPNAVRRICLTYASGMNETYTFDGLAAHRFYQVNIKESVVSYASAAHQEQRHIGQRRDSIQPKRFNRLFGGLFSRSQRAISQPVENKASLEIRKAPTDTPPHRRRVRLPGSDVEVICHVVYIPVQQEGTATIVITPNNDVYVGGLSKRISNRRVSSEKMLVHHRLTCPSEQPDLALAFISISPSIYYDFVEKTNHVGIVVGYSNGEVWFWQFDRGTLQGDAGTELRKARQNSIPGLGDIYWPPQSSCVSVAMTTPLTSVSDEALPLVTLTTEEGSNGVLPNAKVWLLAYLPTLKALSFVGRGMVILAADSKQIQVFDLRESHGFERIKLNPGYQWCQSPG